MLTLVRIALITGSPSSARTLNPVGRPGESIRAQTMGKPMDWLHYFDKFYLENGWTALCCKEIALKANLCSGGHDGDKLSSICFVKYAFLALHVDDSAF